MGHKGYYGQYTGNAKWSRNHADTKVTKSNYKASERDDAAHIDYLKRDINYDNKHGHSDENMTADEKHISKLAGDMKYDKEHHGSPAKKAADAGRSGHPSHMQPGFASGKVSGDEHWRVHQQKRHHQSAPTKHINEHMDKDHPHNKRKDHDDTIHSHKGKPGKTQSKAVAKMISPLRHEREDKKEHLHGRIERKTGKKKCPEGYQINKDGKCFQVAKLDRSKIKNN